MDRDNVNNIDPATGRRPLPQFGHIDFKSSGSNTHGRPVRRLHGSVALAPRTSMSRRLLHTQRISYRSVVIV
jgi:hypothetical protein